MKSKQSGQVRREDDEKWNKQKFGLKGTHKEGCLISD